ncbi:MAG: hypothetical protein KGI67_02515 [Pseudomonadota bacterium]|nr:hypothetical protein [Pseudomonadota bacterium]
MDGKDYSVFSILPPYNNLHAQLVRRDGAAATPVSSGVTVTYEAVADPSGSINTGSAGKTNFWSWAARLFGSAPAAGVGLTGNPAPGTTPAPLAFNAGRQWWEATGIPVTPYDDAGHKNYYPMVKVVARDAAGTVLASTSVVLPVSDEISCRSCHASTSGNAAAQPAAGWVNDPDPEKDWKRNVLLLHDDRVPAAIVLAGKQALYTGSGLAATAAAGQPVLCAACHQSNALGTPRLAGILSLTAAIHSRHAYVADPTSGSALESNTTRSACYLCHPGSVTKCLRGVMGNAVGANGLPAIDCQSCHGPMSAVGAANRDGWLDEPQCQQCHDRPAAGAPFTRFTSTLDAATGLPRSTVDPLFATSADVPAPGKSLYRYSRGHGGLQCEACHGATHAEYPSSHVNDNLQSIALQGYAGTLRECGSCHQAALANPVNGGPHGMHLTGSAWVSQHRTVGWSAACAVCHGSDARGTALSRDASGAVVGCYNCHNGPTGG